MNQYFFLKVVFNVLRNSKDALDFILKEEGIYCVAQIIIGWSCFEFHIWHKGRYSLLVVFVIFFNNYHNQMLPCATIFIYLKGPPTIHKRNTACTTTLKDWKSIKNALSAPISHGIWSSFYLTFKCMYFYRVFVILEFKTQLKQSLQGALNTISEIKCLTSSLEKLLILFKTFFFSRWEV